MRVLLRVLVITALTLGGWYWLASGKISLNGGRVTSTDGARMRAENGCRLGYVYDGDTVEIKCPDQNHTARVTGLDTPETKSPGCPEELALGKQATLRLRQIVGSGVVSFEHVGTDKYRRPLIVLRVDGADVAPMLVSEGLAVAYRGGARPDWCQKLGAA